MDLREVFGLIRPGQGKLECEIYHKLTGTMTRVSVQTKLNSFSNEILGLGGPESAAQGGAIDSRSTIALHSPHPDIYGYQALTVAGDVYQVVDPGKRATSQQVASWSHKCSFLETAISKMMP